MNDEHNPPWIRLFDDAIGLIVIIIALVAVLELSFSFTYALEVLSFGLVAIGISWIVWSIIAVRINIYVRVFMFVTGVTAIGISLIEFIFISLPPDLLIIFPALAMLLVGTSRLVLGIFVGGVSLWIQMLQGLAGILTINLAAFVFIFPNVDFPEMLILLVIAFIFNGLVRLIVGRTEFKEKCMQSTEVDCVKE